MDDCFLNTGGYCTGAEPLVHMPLQKNSPPVNILKCSRNTQVILVTDQWQTAAPTVAAAG